MLFWWEKYILSFQTPYELLFRLFVLTTEIGVWLILKDNSLQTWAKYLKQNREIQ